MWQWQSCVTMSARVHIDRGSARLVPCIAPNVRVRWSLRKAVRKLVLWKSNITIVGAREPQQQMHLEGKEPTNNDTPAAMQGARKPLRSSVWGILGARWFVASERGCTRKMERMQAGGASVRPVATTERQRRQEHRGGRCFGGSSALVMVGSTVSKGNNIIRQECKSFNTRRHLS